MRIALTQPTYLPWLGYFALIDACDKFIFLDDVQFVRRSWMSRNRLYDPELGRIRLLSVPVNHESRKKITAVTIANTKWKSSHHRLVRHIFRKAPHLAEVMWIMESLYETTSTLLIDYTMPIIHKILKILGIQTPILRSSEFPEHHSFMKTARVAHLVERVGGSRLLTQPTAFKAYLDLKEFRDRNLGVEMFEYDHPHYDTGFHFEPYMSVLELIGWVDPGERLKILRSGTRIITLLELSLKTQVD